MFASLGSISGGMSWPSKDFESRGQRVDEISRHSFNQILLGMIEMTNTDYPEITEEKKQELEALPGYWMALFVWSIAESQRKAQQKKVIDLRNAMYDLGLVR